MRVVVLLMLAAFLAACGPPLVWDRPNTSHEEVRLDAAQCRSLARDQAFRESFFAFPGGPYHGFFPYSGARRQYDPFGDPFFHRDVRENELQHFCLRAKGYRLVPAQPSPQ